MILFPDTPQPNFLLIILEIFEVKMMSPSNLFEPVRDIQSALGLVLAGFGITIVNEGVVNLYSKDLVFLPLSEEFAFSPIILRYRKKENYTVVDNFVNVAKKIFNHKLKST